MLFGAFRCGHCSELIREKPLAAGGGAGRLMIVVAVLLLFLTGRIGWFGYFTALVLVPILIVVVHVFVILIVGYSLEPAGRLTLGDAAPDDEETE